MNPQRLTMITIALAVLVVAGILVVPRLMGPAAVTLNVEGQPAVGNASAAATLVIFEDFRCPACQNFILNVFPTLQREYVDQGNLRVVSVNFPVLGPASEHAARIAECVYRQSNEAFWEMKPPLYRAQAELADTRRARELALTYAPGVDATQLDACLADASSLEAVRTDTTMATGLSVNATPTLFVNGVRVASPTLAAVRSAIDDALRN